MTAVLEPGVVFLLRRVVKKLASTLSVEFSFGCKRDVTLWHHCLTWHGMAWYSRASVHSSSARNHPKRQRVPLEGSFMRNRLVALGSGHTVRTLDRVGSEGQGHAPSLIE